MNHSTTFFIASLIVSVRNLIPFPRILSSYNHFLNATIASPIVAVIVSISTFASPKRLVSILKTNLTPPVVIVRTISIAANKPANDLFTLSAALPLTINFSDKL